MTPKKTVDQLKLDLTPGEQAYLRKLADTTSPPLITDVPRYYRRALSFHGLIEGKGFDGNVWATVTEKGHEYLEMKGEER